MTKARPILFSAPMVKALLAGRKTQTRRLVKPQPPHEMKDAAKEGFVHLKIDLLKGIKKVTYFPTDCPYGAVGDYLWVRETWMKARNLNNHYSPRHCLYRADGESIQSWKPSIHMPKWASRLTLLITDIRAERLQDISEEDAIAEGIYQCESGYFWYDVQTQSNLHRTALNAYRKLWESINGDGSWEANPWVWVVNFEVINKNVSEAVTGCDQLKEVKNGRQN